MPRLLICSESQPLIESIEALCASIGWEGISGRYDVSNPEGIVKSGSDAALLDVDDSSSEVQASLRRLAESSPFFPVIVAKNGCDASAEQGASVLYHLNRDRLEDIEHILISLSCAGFSWEDPRALAKDGSTSMPRILVVDDDVRLNAAMVQALRATEKYHVRSVHSGFQAGAILAEFRPHVVVVDISLGDMDGREVCALIRRHVTLADTKVIGVSGYLPTDSVEDQGNEFDSFMEKPFLLRDLVDRVKTLVG